MSKHSPIYDLCQSFWQRTEATWNLKGANFICGNSKTKFNFTTNLVIKWLILFKTWVIFLKKVIKREPFIEMNLKLLVTIRILIFNFGIYAALNDAVTPFFSKPRSIKKFQSDWIFLARRSFYLASTWLRLYVTDQKTWK